MRLTLPSDLIGRVMDLLEPNDQVLAARLSIKDAWRRFSQPQHCTAHFGKPLPAHAFDPAWQPHLQQAMKQLSLCYKLRALSTAVASGSEVNLELAWGLLRPCLFPELLSHDRQGLYLDNIRGVDAGTTAVRSGHAHLLPWLVQHGCPLDPRSTLEAAAEHCELAGMQQAWELLGGSAGVTSNEGDWVRHACALAKAAARSDATVDKLLWLLSVLESGPLERNHEEFLAAAAVGAAASGRVPVLRWLCAQGLELYTVNDRGHFFFSCTPATEVLATALQHGHLDAADWLVDEAGYPLPPMGDDQVMRYVRAWEGAATGGCLDAMRWLLRHGWQAPNWWALQAAAGAGQLEALQFLHQECGVPLSASAWWAGAGSRSLATMQWLLQTGCPMHEEVYESAAREGDGAMVRWLALEARCPFENGICDVTWYWHPNKGSDRELEQAVRALVEAGCPPQDDDGGFTCAVWGNLPLLRFLHGEKGWGLGPDPFQWAAKSGCEAVVEWMVEAGLAPGNRVWGDPYVAAASGGDLATLSCMRRLGVPWGVQVLRQAVGSRVPLPALRWLIEQGAPWDEGAVALALQQRTARCWDEETAAWLTARVAEHAAGGTTATDGAGGSTVHQVGM